MFNFKNWKKVILLISTVLFVPHVGWAGEVINHPGPIEPPAGGTGDHGGDPTLMK